MANACGLASLAAGAMECQRTQVRRIVCRMVGDLVQPYFFRSGNLQPWVPDLSTPRGRRRIDAPAQGVPPQCDIGHDPHAPVTWETVMRLLPRMRDDAVLDDLAAAIRLQACLLPDDSLMPVNLGPGLARPVPTREQEHVRVERKKPGGGEAKTAWTLHPDADLAPSSLPPFHNRLIHASVREEGLQTVHCRVAMRAPHPLCSSDAHRQANLAALRSLFAPDLIPARLSVVCELGLESLRDSALPKAHCLYNALCARRQVIQFLDEACTVADFAAQLIEQLESPDATFSWADLRDRAQLGQPYIAQLVKHWHQIPVWTPAGMERQPGDAGRFLWTDASLKFKAPAPYDRQQSFLAQLLQTRNAVLVRAGAHSDAFYRCPLLPLHHDPHLELVVDAERGRGLADVPFVEQGQQEQGLPAHDVHDFRLQGPWPVQRVASRTHQGLELLHARFESRVARVRSHGQREASERDEIHVLLVHRRRNPRQTRRR